MAKDIYKKLQPVIEQIISRRKKNYVGELSPAQAAEGIHAALMSAKALLDDAVLLFEHKRYARAASMAVLSIEEYGKIAIIRRILLGGESEPLSKVWQEYRHHHAKNVTWLMPQLAADGHSYWDQLMILHNEGFQHSSIPDFIKQAGFYSEITPAGQWLTPEESITESIAQMFVGSAQQVIPVENPLSTPEALALMVSHVKPVVNTGDQSLIKQAWLAYYQEAELLGYLNEGDAERMRAMFNGDDGGNGSTQQSSTTQ